MVLVTVRVGGAEEIMAWDEFEARVRAGRVPPDGEVLFSPLTGTRFVPARTLAVYEALSAEGRFLRARFAQVSPPIVTALLLGVQIRLFWFAQVSGADVRLTAALANWSGAVFEDGHVWRLLTMGLLHVDALHILSNGVWFAGTGLFIERTLGRIQLAVIFLASVLGGSVLSTLFSPFAWSIGASGGVFGMVAACFVFVLVRPDLVPPRQRWFALLLLPYMVWMFFSGLENRQVDNWGHLGGLVTGAILGLLLDPHGVDRRPGWNRRVLLLVLAVGGGVLAAAGLLGPRIEPLIDERDAVRIVRAEVEGQTPVIDDTRAVVWKVPAGWRPGGGVTGTRGFTSSMGDRLFGVTVRLQDHVTTAEEVADAWKVSVLRTYPEAQVDPPRPVGVAGVDGLSVRARFPAGDPTLPQTMGPFDPRSLAGVRPRAVEVDWRVAVRGAWVLEGIWQVETPRARWLAPLAERLWAEIDWREPAAWVAARDAVQSRPTSGDARMSLARELARLGDAAGAAEQCSTLVEMEPANSNWWEGCFEVAQIGRVRGAPLEAWVERALRENPVPKTVAAAARALAADGQVDTARGLLDIAWSAGSDAALARVRRELGLPTASDPPVWWWTHDPVTGRRRPAAQMERWTEWSLSLADARAAGAWWSDEQQRTVAATVSAIRAGDPAALLALSVQKNGRTLLEDPDARAALIDDVVAAASGRAPDWMGPDIAAALSANPAFVSRVTPVH